jgi:hypothetical protein
MNNKEHKSSDFSSCESYGDESNFVRKLKKRFGKYKCELPFKCFKYGKVKPLMLSVHMQKMKVVMMKKTIT